eukprot:jgi/Ulvmu1/8354/UM042_0060.1
MFRLRVAHAVVWVWWGAACGMPLREAMLARFACMRMNVVVHSQCTAVRMTTHADYACRLRMQTTHADYACSGTAAASMGPPVATWPPNCGCGQAPAGWRAR